MEKHVCGILVATQLMGAWLAAAQTKTYSTTEQHPSAIHVIAKSVAAVSTGDTDPAIAISARYLDFATVPVGGTSTLSLTVQNAGGGIIAGEAKVSAPFSVIRGSPYVLGSSQSRVITVQYRPYMAGMNMTVMRLTGGGGASITVSGSAFPARRGEPALPRNLRLLAVR
ncbi:exported hypothetical protein [Verrucomicrobia bacterium]|nr:exported hypothetical protein [Verrucomicrobiota bacterium]